MKTNEVLRELMETGALSYIVYTGAVKDATMGDYGEQDEAGEL